MSFLNTADLAEAESFKRRLMVGIVKIAGTILEEQQNEMSTQRAEKRLALANSAFRDPRNLREAFIWPVLSNATIAEAGLDAPDSDLEFQIAQVWDQVAGVTAADKVT